METKELTIIEQLASWRCRCSAFGKIVIEDKGLTEKQLSRISELETRKLGLNGEKPLTANMEQELAELIEKRDAPPELSASAKKELDNIYAEIVSGVNSSIISKYYERGIASEPDALHFAQQTIHPNITPVPNDEFIENEWVMGTPDIEDPGHEISETTDTKCAWSLETLHSAKLSKEYEWQPRCYAFIRGYKRFAIMYVLVDMPEYLVKRECQIHFNQNAHIYLTDTDPEYLKWCELYQEKTRYSKYPKHMRFKLFTDTWRDEYADTIKLTITKAREYLLAKHMDKIQEYTSNFELMCRLNPNQYKISDLSIE